MKSRVQLLKHPEEDKPGAPLIYTNMSRLMLNFVLHFMRIYGIARISITHSNVGIMPIIDVGFQPLGITPPEELLKSRNYMVRRLADMMFLFGIIDVEAILDPNESETIRNQWHQLQTADPGQTLQPQSSLQNIKLNVEDDPTGKSVLPPTSGTETAE